MLYEIKHKDTGAVLYACEAESLKACVEMAVNDGANLDGAYLAGAYLAGAYLAGANLAGANLDGAYLAGANLARAYLAGANLDGAYLAGANLARAYLAGAYLAGAYLARAYLAGANLAGADSIISAGYPDGWTAFGWLRDGVIQVRVGCRDFSLAEGRTYWAGKADRREVLAAMDYIEACAKLRGWEIKS